MGFFCFFVFLFFCFFVFLFFCFFVFFRFFRFFVLRVFFLRARFLLLACRQFSAASVICRFSYISYADLWHMPLKRAGIALEYCLFNCMSSYDSGIALKIICDK